MNREVLYERTVSGSYMKVPMSLEGALDEKILLRKNLQGLLPMEKVFVNQGAWYWYNISGTQSLEHYSRLHSLDSDMITNIITTICREAECMEQNYLSPDCLVLDCEYIFISNQTKEVNFMAYPGHNQSLQKGFMFLMEYLLTKIDHKDVEGVRQAYKIYEKTLEEGYTLEEVRNCILAARQEVTEENEREYRIKEREDETRGREDKGDETKVLQQEEIQSPNIWKTFLEEKMEWINQNVEEWKMKLQELLQLIPGKAQKNAQREIKDKKGKKGNEWARKEDAERRGKQSIVVMPEEEEEEMVETIHPTICLTDYRDHPRGLLLYEGMEHFGNISLNAASQQIGKSKEASIRIEKDTISALHAGIFYEEQEYFLEDYNSTNGTYVNNEMLAYREKRLLKCNDIVRFADVKYRFV